MFEQLGNNKCKVCRTQHHFCLAIFLAFDPGIIKPLRNSASCEHMKLSRLGSLRKQMSFPITANLWSFAWKAAFETPVSGICSSSFSAFCPYQPFPEVIPNRKTEECQRVETPGRTASSTDRANVFDGRKKNVIYHFFECLHILFINKVG